MSDIITDRVRVWRWNRREYMQRGYDRERGFLRLTMVRKMSRLHCDMFDAMHVISREMPGFLPSASSPRA